MIPVASPKAAYQALQSDIDAAVQRVLHSGRYILGPDVEAFEAEFASQMKVAHCVAVASGTDALWLALRAAGIGPDDEVLVPALTASATPAAVAACGARPVFTDVRPGDLTMNPAALEGALSSRTRAVLPVHLYGSPAAMDDICAFCHANGLALVEDCAQAHGAEHRGKTVGSFGLCAAWSFYPTKNLGALGDGGMVGTNSAALADSLRELREYGWRERQVSSRQGWNSRLDELQAAVLRVKLAVLGAGNARRRAIAARYREEFAGLLNGPAPAEGALGAEHLFVLRHPQRDRLRRVLAHDGVATAIHYPVPCHLQAAYAQFERGEGSLPVAEAACREVFSLPLWPEMGDAAVETVIAAVRNAAGA